MKKPNSKSRANPRVSVIIPVYNRAHLVNRAIESVLNQTYQDFELIVVDDGSTDNTAEVVHSVRDERIKYVRHQSNRGPSAARNTGIRAASGELIGFLDSDDEWLPEKLQRQVDKFDSASANVGLVYGGYVVIDNEKKKTIREVYPKKRGYMFKEMLKMAGPPDYVSMTLVRRECFEKVGLFDEGMRFVEDWDMWVRIAAQYKFDFVGEMVAKYYVSQHQLTRDHLGLVEGVSTFAEKHQHELSENPAILAYVLKWLGQRHLVEHNDRATARRYLIEAIRANPRGVRLYLHLLAAYTVSGLYKAVLNTQLVLSFRKYSKSVLDKLGIARRQKQ
jgi:glycosyltransferase involved in cell wall biosynthesis